MSTAVLSKPITAATRQNLPVGRVKPVSQIRVTTPTPLIAIRSSIKMSNVARPQPLNVPRGWTLVELLRDPDALLVYRSLTPRQVGMIRCRSVGCKATATMRYGMYRSVNGKDVIRSAGMFACSVEHVGAHTTYRQDKPDASLYPLESFRRVKGSSIGRSSEGGAMPGRHAGGKSARRSRLISSMMDDD